MPPVVVAAGIAAAGSVAAGAMGSRASNKATTASAKANSDALAFQREQEAGRRAEFDKAQGRYEQQWNAWNANRNALLQRYGVDIGSPQMGQPAQPGTAPQTGAAPQAVPQRAPMPAAGVPARPETAVLGQTLGDLMNRGASPETAQASLDGVWNPRWRA
jgi:hypothetical protein